MRVDKVIILICLLSFLMSVGIIGCANTQPTWTVEEWERARRAAGIGIAGGN